MTRILAIILLMLSLIAGPAFAQDSPRGFVEGLLENVLAAEGRSLSIENVSISFTGDVTVAKVTVRDGSDAWLEIEQLSLAWRPLSLFGKQLDVTALTAGKVHIIRLPQSPEGAVAAPAELTGLRAAIIRQLEIAMLQIDRPVLGQNIEMKLVGAAEITVSPIEIRADMTASRLDGRKGDLSARVVLDPQTRQLTLDAGFSEDADGVIANLLALRGDPAVDANLSAAGTLSDWTGSFSLNLDQAESFAGSATATTETLGQRIAVVGGGELAPLLPLWLERPFAGVSTLSAKALIPKGTGAAEIDHISLNNTAYGFRMSGVADWTGTRNNLTAELIAKDAAAAFDLPVTTLLGSGKIAGLQLRAQIEGAYSAPSWRASVSWASLAADRVGIKEMVAAVQGQGLGPLTFGGDVSAVTVQGQTADLPPVALGPLKGSFAGSLQAGGVLDITQSRLAAGAISLESTGRFLTETGSFGLSIAGSTENPKTGIAALDRLFEGPVQAEGRITGGGSEGVVLDGLALTSSALEAKATGRASAAEADLALEVMLPDLAQLHEGLAGTAFFNASLKGPWQTLAARLDGKGENVTLMGKSFDTPVVTAEVFAENDAPKGKFTASGLLDGRSVDITAGFETDAAGDLVLNDLAATAGSARLSGDLRWPKGNAPTGRLDFSAPDLREVAPLFLTEIQGSASGDIIMSGSSDAHETEIRFTGLDVAVPTFAAATADGNVTIATLFGIPRPVGQVTLTAARLGDQRFDSIAFSAESSGSQTYRATAKLSGPDLSLDADADVTLGNAEALYVVSRLQGKLRGIAFSAAAPLTLRQQQETLTLEAARLNIGKGSVKVGGRLLPDLDATLRLASLPLTAFRGLAGLPGLQGTISGDATLLGTVSAPEGSFKISGSGLSADSLVQLGVKPFKASASGTVSGRTVTAMIAADAGKQLSVTGKGTIDLAVSRIDMAMKGQTGPALFADQLARNGIRADGAVGFDLRLTGAVAKPDINGRITLSKGVLGDAAGRFTLRDAVGTAEVRNRSVQISSLYGTTGRKGRASVTGSIALDAGLTADLNVRVENGLYTDGSFVTSRYDARLRITGPLLRAPFAAGEIDLRDTKITLSELPRRALTPDDVKHINASRAVALQSREIRRNRPTGSSNFRVDVRLRALNAVSVSGRGLNVILNGGLRVYGLLDNLAADGSFQMVRGRLTLPARSLDFERGSLTFDRDLDPKINFVAVSRRRDATITLTVSGYASEPSIQVTSVPQMLQEEAMARLIFDNSMLELSPLQIAQIASYVATLSGGGDSGLLSGLQSALGLDQLSITENESGDTQVGIAKRLNDRLSIGIEQTTQTNTTRVIIDLSATPELKVRGSIDSDGASRVGVYYEKDY